MELQNWDPLEKTDLSAEIISASVKREIKNILKSYTGWYDPLCELIQNALDAVDDRKKKEASYIPEIWIKIDLQSGIICVTDNGIGFKEDEFKNFIAPNVSFKKSGDRGNKGVGATYLAYGFNSLQFGTRTPEFSFVGTLKDGRLWVEDDTNSITRPKIQKSDAIHEAFASVDRGSTFALILVGDLIRPKDLKWVGASTAEQWEAVLRIKTPLGGLYFNRKPWLSCCHLEVIDEKGDSTEKVISKCEYIFPHNVISTCQDLKTIKQKQQELASQGKDTSKLPDSFNKLNGLFNNWSYVDFSPGGEFKDILSPDELSLAQKYKISVYGFFCYSTEIWDKYNDEVVKIRKGARILRGGIQLGTNCMPQGELLIIPLTETIGYQNVTHVVVHFEEADPDLGRKGFQPELQELARKIGTLLVSRFKNWRRLLKKQTGAPPDIIGEKNIYDWIVAQEAHEKMHPLLITRQDVFLPIKEPSITSNPLNEQDVIALFNQLLAGGVIRGVKLMSTDQHQQYDGIFRLYLKKPFENHIYDPKSNPLGVESSVVTAEYIGAPGILEYKYSFDGLLEEIEKGEKIEKDIKLVIAWVMGSKWRSRYEITPLLHFSNIHHRYFHGGTHIIKGAATSDRVFPAIILSELIDYINNPDSVQDYQKDTYMD